VVRYFFLERLSAQLAAATRQAQMKTTIELAGTLGKSAGGEPLTQSLLEAFRTWHEK
jgi:hypothetical protein